MVPGEKSACSVASNLDCAPLSFCVERFGDWPRSNGRSRRHRQDVTRRSGTQKKTAPPRSESTMGTVPLPPCLFPIFRPVRLTIATGRVRVPRRVVTWPTDTKFLHVKASNPRSHGPISSYLTAVVVFALLFLGQDDGRRFR